MSGNVISHARCLLLILETQHATNHFASHKKLVLQVAELIVLLPVEEHSMLAFPLLTPFSSGYLPHDYP